VLMPNVWLVVVVRCFEVTALVPLHCDGGSPAVW
jgi:hypothetical protein